MKITLTRQVLSCDGRMLAPGTHDVPDAEAEVYRSRGWTDRRPAPRKPPEPPREPPPDPVPIPPDWRDLHPLALRRLAKDLTGHSPSKIEDAVGIIESELTRRETRDA